MNMLTIQTSVRHLVEFILRSGNIDAGFFVANRALEGQRVHQRIQKLRREEIPVYQKEVTLTHTYEHKGIRFQIEGRADGMFTEDGKTTIEEIKSTMLPLSQIEADPSHWHWAQAKCYAFIYGEAHDEAEMGCSLIYSHVETGEWTVFTETFSMDGLRAFVLTLIERYWDFAKLEADCADDIRESGTALHFPYETYREGQRELAVAVYAAVLQEKKLFAQAPTGIGKTMATLFSAVKALAEGHGEKIFYATSKTVQRHLAETALSHMTGQGLKIRAITLTAKDKICPNETRNCDPRFCRYADGHFNRVNKAILDCVRSENIITRAVVESYAAKHQVCPAEYALDISIFCQVIICDYNHIYDPKARLKRFFADNASGGYIILLDEAHNLVDRAREMFSAGLHRKPFAELRKSLGRKHPLRKSLGEIASALREHREDDLPASLQAYAAACELHFKDNPQADEDILTMYFAALDYLRVADLFDERYVIYKEPDYIRQFCIDPAHLLEKEQKKARASIFFSATLTPLPYFQGILGGSSAGDDFTLRLHSPFPRGNLCVIAEVRISTKYRQREASLDAVADSLYSMVSAKQGNYMAFFPSYAYLSQVYERFEGKYEGAVTLLRQEQGAGNEQEFLANFEEDGGRTLLGFVVLGGAFSEGIDLKGERLIGAAVVGVGMPLISEERGLIAAHFSKDGKRGFDYAYVYPGMNKVLQAAGRVIRGEGDRGVVLLIDSRYAQGEYAGLFPWEWRGYVRLGGRARLGDVLAGFWGG